MRVTISSSSSDLIDDKYKKSSEELISFLAGENIELNWGSGSSSIMGISYKRFSERGNKINGYTTPKYVSDIDNLPKASHTVYDDTFDLKKNIFIDADIIVCLPGGIGTISEFFAFLEEIRSNDKSKLVILYNKDHHFDTTIALIDGLVKRNFNNNSIYNYFKIANSLVEFKELFYKNIN